MATHDGELVKTAAQPPNPCLNPEVTRPAIERWLPLLWLALAGAVVAPTFRHPDAFALSYDWRYFETVMEVGRRSVAWFHQLPLWNPWMCGGEVYLANPQSLVATPTFPLLVAFGTALGAKLTLVAYHFLALDGQFRLARSYRLSLLASALAAVSWGAGGWLAIRFSTGHCNFFGAALFPYAMYFLRRAGEEWEWSIPLGLVLAWIVGGGGTSTAPICVVLLATLAGTEASARRSWRPLLLLGGAGLVALLVGAVRVLPVLEFAHDHPRHMTERDTNWPWLIVRDAYAWWAKPGPGRRYQFHEYGWHLPTLTAPLWLWSLRLRRTRPLWVLVVVGAALALGSVSVGGGQLRTPWLLLHHLPIYRDLRVPSRYLVLLAIAVPLLCGHALDDLRARVRFGRGLAWAVLVLCSLEALAYSWARYAPVFQKPIALAGPSTALYQTTGSWEWMMWEVFANRGVIDCDEAAPLQRARSLQTGPGPQARLAEPAAGSIESIQLTPNRVTVTVDLHAPTTLLVNQNWNEHWRAERRDGGAAPLAVVRVGDKWPTDSAGAQLGARLPPGHYTVVFSYRPRSFVVGAWLSGLCLPLALLGWGWSRRRRAADAAGDLQGSTGSLR